MAEAEDLDRWTRIGQGDIVLWRETDGSVLRWCASRDGWLEREGRIGPSLEEATLGLSTTAFIKIWDRDAYVWGPVVPDEIPKPPPAWLLLGEGDLVMTDLPNGYERLALRLEGGRWCPDVFPHGVMQWSPPGTEQEFWAEHGRLEDKIASGVWHKAWDSKTQTGRWQAE